MFITREEPYGGEIFVRAGTMFAFMSVRITTKLKGICTFTIV